MFVQQYSLTTLGVAFTSIIHLWKCELLLGAARRIYKYALIITRLGHQVPVNFPAVAAEICLDSVGLCDAEHTTTPRAYEEAVEVLKGFHNGTEIVL